MSRILFLFSLLILFGAPANALVARACTQEAKICPDGTGVGRTGPHCEFAPCPGEQPGEKPGDPSTRLPDPTSCPKDARTCPDGATTVGRVGPSCDFAPCPGEAPEFNPNKPAPPPGAPGMVLPGSPPVTGGGTPGIACPMSMKLCDDGTSVGATGPNCEFPLCPGEKPLFGQGTDNSPAGPDTPGTVTPQGFTTEVPKGTPKFIDDQ